MNSQVPQRPNEIPEEWLSAYLDNELDLDQRRLVEQAVSENPNYAQLLHDLKATRNLIQQLPSFPSSVAMRSPSSSDPQMMELEDGLDSGSSQPKESKPSKPPKPSAAPNSALSGYHPDQLSARLNENDGFADDASGLRLGNWSLNNWRLLAIAASIVGIGIVGSLTWWGITGEPGSSLAKNDSRPSSSKQIDPQLTDKQVGPSANLAGSVGSNESPNAEADLLNLPPVSSGNELVKLPAPLSPAPQYPQEAQSSARAMAADLVDSFPTPQADATTSNLMERTAPGGFGANQLPAAAPPTDPVSALAAGGSSNTPMAEGKFAEGQLPPAMQPSPTIQSPANDLVRALEDPQQPAPLTLQSSPQTFPESNPPGGLGGLGGGSGGMPSDNLRGGIGGGDLRSGFGSGDRGGDRAGSGGRGGSGGQLDSDARHKAMESAKSKPEVLPPPANVSADKSTPPQIRSMDGASTGDRRKNLASPTKQVEPRKLAPIAYAFSRSEAWSDEMMTKQLYSNSLLKQIKPSESKIDARTIVGQIEIVRTGVVRLPEDQRKALIQQAQELNLTPPIRDQAQTAQVLFLNRNELNQVMSFTTEKVDVFWVDPKEQITSDRCVLLVNPE